MKRIRVLSLAIICALLSALIIPVCAAGTVTKTRHLSPLALIGLVFIVSAIITVVIVLKKWRDHRPATSVGDSNDYLAPDSFHLTASNDVFVHATTVKRAKQNDAKDD